MRYAILLAAFSALVLTNCKASVSVNAKTSSSESEETTEVKSAPAPAVVSEAPKIPHTEFLGVARRLSIAPNQAQKTANCECLSVLVGNGTESTFDWRGQPSEVGYDAMAVAVSAEGIACSKPGRGPSVKGFERHGDDVIVTVEEWHPSRPQAFGAVVPNPGPQGHIYVKALGKSPYGRPIGAGFGPHGKWCRVGTGTAFDGYTPNTAPSDEGDDTSRKHNGAYDDVGPGSSGSSTGGGAPATVTVPVPAPAGNQ